ncbi:hypothetical protein TNCV_2789101 [Trichonephila clavipes]|uniref:Uncharacterized protein n=1 Tax=Trichonephila clavipes TaxID=2585209 RepID=A0A8X6VW68_TRICX|nr:hypothetical protein TNCV_2789101 [Trichonephila clavipes]
MAPHRPRKSTPTESTTDEDDMIMYDVQAEELEPNPEDKFAMMECFVNNPMQKTANEGAGNRLPYLSHAKPELYHLSYVTGQHSVYLSKHTLTLTYDHKVNRIIKVTAGEKLELSEYETENV